jgi:hypothetical protein
LGIPAEIVRTFTGHKDAKVMERYFKFNAEQQRQMMQKFNVKHDEVETVFDYKITDEERERLNISEKQSYNNSIKGNPALLQLHVALLMNIRGEVVKSLEMASRLPDSMKLDYMNAIKTGL